MCAHVDLLALAFHCEPRVRASGHWRFEHELTSCAARATRTQVLTMALARTTGAGRPPSCYGTPTGYWSVRST
eukprot:2376715-Pleurochrysis_carterae.AAC.2